MGSLMSSTELTMRQSTMLRPPRRHFVFTYIHGIRWSDVAAAPSFGDYWPRLSELLGPVDFIAAHNASFDRGVLAACCGAAGVDAPAQRFVCTMALARRVWSIRPTRLPDVCGRLGIPLQHHEALSDARGCAHIVIEARRAGAVV